MPDGGFLGSIATFDSLLKQLSTLREQLLERHTFELRSCGQGNEEEEDAIVVSAATKDADAVVRAARHHHVAFFDANEDCQSETMSNHDRFPNVMGQPLPPSLPGQFSPPFERNLSGSSRSPSPPAELPGARAGPRPTVIPSAVRSAPNRSAQCPVEEDESFLLGGGNGYDETVDQSWHDANDQRFLACLQNALCNVKSAGVTGATSKKMAHLLETWEKQASLLHVPLNEILPPPKSHRTSMASVPSRVSMVKVFSLPKRRVMACFAPWISKWDDSFAGRAWFFLSLLILAYDLVMVPIAVCFQLKEDRTSFIIGLSACYFWTFDAIVGVIRILTLERDPRVGSDDTDQKCATASLVLDIFVICVDWLVLCADGAASSSLQVLLLFRFLRYLRLLKLKPYWQHLLLRSSTGRNIGTFTLVLTFVVGVITHFVACMWYVIGNELDDGWVHVNNVDSMSSSRRYMLSLQWSVGYLHGANPRLEVNTTLETGLEAMYLLVCLMIVTCYVSTIMRAMISNTAPHSKLRMSALQYVSRNHISLPSYARMMKHVSLQQSSGPWEVIRAEESLFGCLPRFLQEELRYDSRYPYVCTVHFLEGVHGLESKAVRQLCFEAISSLLVAEGELVFNSDESARLMCFLTSGKFTYKIGNAKRSISQDPGIEQELAQGSNLSEAALWVHWEHCGELKATEDSLCLILNNAIFGNVISHYWSCRVLAVKYARVCLREVREGSCNDMTRFHYPFGELDDLLACMDEFEYGGDHDSHVLFISHYKHEAGTEAALMRHALKNLITIELDCPVFVDSEDLVDLATIQRHVSKSSALVVLLTPGILTRPWCVLEIVTAFLKDVQIIPVVIQRDGIPYDFPDEDFYCRLRKGEILDKVGLRLLHDVGITMRDTEAAIRHMFKKIALPFSPHKSENIRGAELLDIMKRIPLENWQVQEDRSPYSPVLHRNPTSSSLSGLGGSLAGQSLQNFLVSPPTAAFNGGPMPMFSTSSMVMTATGSHARPLGAVPCSTSAYHIE